MAPRKDGRLLGVLLLLEAEVNHTQKFKALYQVSGLVIALVFGAMAVFVTIYAPNAEKSTVRGQDIAPWLVPWILSGVGMLIYALPILWPRIAEAYKLWRNKDKSPS